MIKIQLPDYKRIISSVKVEKVEVLEKEIEEALYWLKKSRAKFTIKNEPAQKGDFVEIEYLLFQIESNWRKDAFILGEGYFLPGFEDQIIGMKAGEKKDNVVLKKDGKDILVNLKLKSVQNVEFPELNDNFIKGLGNFTGLNDFKKTLKKELQKEKEERRKGELIEKILESIIKETEIEIPPLWIEREKKQMIEEFKSQTQKIEVSKDLLDFFQKEAEKRIKKFLVLKAIGEKEGVEVLDKEVEERARQFLRNFSGVKDSQEELDLQRLREYTKEVIRIEKIYQLIESLLPKK